MALSQGLRQVALMSAVLAIFILGLSSRPRAHEDDQFVFGELRSQVLELTTRATVCFTPTMSFQF